MVANLCYANSRIDLEWYMLRWKEICSQDDLSDSSDRQTIHHDRSLTVNHLRLLQTITGIQYPPLPSPNLLHSYGSLPPGHSTTKLLQANHTCPQLAYILVEALYSNLDDMSFAEFGNHHIANDPEYRRPHQLGTRAYLYCSEQHLP